MSFDADFADEGLPELVAQFGETIVYRPRDGLPRSVSAIVNRDPPAKAGLEGAPLPKLTVTLENHRTRGVAADELDLGGDKVEVAVRAGGVPETLAVSMLVNDDGGCLVLGVR